MSNKSKLYIKIPTYIIRNEDFFIGNDEFLLYARLSFLYFRNYKNPEIKVDHKKLMINISITDTRTLKKRLNVLYDLKLIENKIDKLPRRGEVTILINKKIIDDSKNFTMMNAGIFNMMESLDEDCIRLLFYYKSHITKKDTHKQYCFVGYETLRTRLKIGNETIRDANDILKKLKLIKIEKHELKHDFEYGEDDELIFNKFNNHYIVNRELF
ncbi:hypothetical protein [Metabacillus arenae]|uniref:Uncharacterized protein n=1 Tax=Metabacillus arenae TaxID=2771434 RepID=A0A926NCT8_9BACI|nr:hypothetical protein [Metabacillus arenae]MBD1379179.1 hypothetical protein [Metabacillus arenae]